MIEGFAGVGTHMYLSQRNAKLTLTHLQPRGDVLVVVHDGRALETYELRWPLIGAALADLVQGGYPDLQHI